MLSGAAQPASGASYQYCRNNSSSELRHATPACDIVRMESRSSQCREIAMVDEGTLQQAASTLARRSSLESHPVRFSRERNRDFERSDVNLLLVALCAAPGRLFCWKCIANLGDSNSGAIWCCSARRSTRLTASFQVRLRVPRTWKVLYQRSQRRAHS